MKCISITDNKSLYSGIVCVRVYTAWEIMTDCSVCKTKDMNS